MQLVLKRKEKKFKRNRKKKNIANGTSERKIKKRKKNLHKKYEHLAPSVPNNKGVFLLNFTRSYF